MKCQSPNFLLMISSVDLIQLSFQHNHDVSMMLQRQIKASDVPRGNDHRFGRKEASLTLVTALWFLPLWTSACISLVRVVFMSCTFLPFFWCFIFTWTNPSSIGSPNSVFPVSLRSEELWRIGTWFATRTYFLCVKRDRQISLNSLWIIRGACCIGMWGHCWITHLWLIQGGGGCDESRLIRSDSFTISEAVPNHLAVSAKRRSIFILNLLYKSIPCRKSKSHFIDELQRSINLN